MTFKKYKNIILIVAIIIIATVAYTILIGKRDDRLLISENVNDVNQVMNNELISLLLDLRSVKLDGGIFSDPVFRSLEDFSQELAPEPVGRNNPFAPLGVDSNRPISSDNSENGQTASVEKTQ